MAALRYLLLAVLLLGPTWPTAAQSSLVLELAGRHRTHSAAGRDDLAEPLARQALAAAEALPDRTFAARAHGDLGLILARLRRVDEAEAHLRRSLDLYEAARGTDDSWTTDAREDLARFLSGQGRPVEALPLFTRVATARELALGPDAPRTRKAIEGLADAHRDTGDDAAAEAVVRRLLAGPVEDAERATNLNRLGAILLARGRQQEAERTLREALDLHGRVSGPASVRTASVLNNLAMLHRDMNRIAEAEAGVRKAIAIVEAMPSPDADALATYLNNLANLLIENGRGEEALAPVVRATELTEAAHGPGHPAVANRLNSTAVLLVSLGRLADAERMFTRVLALWEERLGPAHPDVATVLVNLASVEDEQGRPDAALGHLRRALGIRERALGPAHPQTIHARALLGEALSAHSPGEAERELRTAMAAAATLPDAPRHADSATWALGRLMIQLKRFDEAENLLLRTVEYRARAYGEDHPELYLVYTMAGGARALRGDHAGALPWFRRAARVWQVKLAAARESDRTRDGWVAHVDLVLGFLRNAHRAGALDDAAFTAEAFPLAQGLLGGEASDALRRSAARLAAADDALAGVVRRRQDIAETWRATDLRLTRALADGDAAAVALRDRSADLARQVGVLDAHIAARFPAYADLAAPRPVALGDLQKLLGPDEAMLAYVFSERTSDLWVLRRDGAHYVPIRASARAVATVVAELRQSLDPTGATSLADLKPFPAGRAHTLYRFILAPAEPFLAGVRHLFVVPDGPLTGLPLGVLTTAPMAVGPSTPESHADVPWLARRYAVTVLPSAASLRMLRAFGRRAQDLKRDAFRGFGDPVLQGDAGTTRSPNAAALFRSRGVADVNAVRALPRLPETADELRTLARALGAGSDTIALGDRATEANVRAADLSRTRILAFATHGLLAGDFREVAEPALVLTPPAAASDEDDGLLTASEIARLRLDADWVVLSACNTAGPDGSADGGGLSGLARAFFYAGARTLLVSNWPVETSAASAITTRLFALQAADPGMGRAEALRRASLELAADRDRPFMAHPAFWAPFVVVGEGGGSEPVRP